MPLNAPISLSDCWAKTDDQGNPSLSTRDHCVNVGAVSWLVKSYLPRTLLYLFPDGGCTLIAAHDIGKISPGFLMKSSVWRTIWQNLLKLQAPDVYESNHAKVSQSYLSTFPLYAKRPPNWLISIGGHHGKYATSKARMEKVFEGDHPWVNVFKETLLEELMLHFGSLPTENPDKSARLHWFTGMMVFCDWIGSNSNWFPTTDSVCSLTVELAKQRAEVALQDIGWHRRGIRSGLTFSQLFDPNPKTEFKPRPLQSKLVEVADAQGLYIVEAPMGEGKTEAALAAAYKRWDEGGEAGLYFALPTQLTSNRIHDRIRSFLTHIVSDPSTLALIHGNAWLTRDRITSLLPTTEHEEGAAASNLWFSDGRKALLAPFGTGTIDQALMSVLPVKHSALRLFALSGKVIVIDEVHSYDPFTSALLDRAVRWLLETGCTVIVLSATLSKSRRAALVAAAGAVEESNSIGEYPLITKVRYGQSTAETIPISTEKTISKEVTLQHIDAQNSDWMTEAASAAEHGACVLIVRNTIGLAQQTLKQLKATCRDQGISFGLLHSRFPQFQRDQNENHWMEQLGKKQSSRPKGCILVGTQVVEQSVDIDADLLITDLAPTDLIFQRIGRLHRHARNRPKGYETARCIILHPNVQWEATEKEILKALGSSAYVYPPFSLFQASRLWNKRSSISIPEEIRATLDESVRIPENLPPGVIQLKENWENLVNQMESTAWMNQVFGAAAVDDIEGSQTRWKSMPSGFIVLLQKSPSLSSGNITLHFLDGSTHSFSPGHFHFQLAQKLHLNACRVPGFLIKDLQKSTPSWLSQHFQNAILAVCQKDSSTCVPFPVPETASYTYFYHSAMGLSHEKNLLTQNEPMDDESWF